MRRHHARIPVVAAVLAFLASPALQAQDEGDDPSRGVARISVINGDVSVRRGDSGDWVAAAVNAPLVVEDRLLTGANSRAEVQFDYANMIRLGSDSEIRLSQLEYRRYQVQVARGITMFRVLRDSDADVEVSTPTVSIRPQKKGIYRVAVREDGESEITVRSGEVEVYTPQGVENLRSGKTMLVRGTASDPEFQVVRAEDRDAFDGWSEQRDRALSQSRSYQYVNRDIYGADDLDSYGVWVDAPGYGMVWRPSVDAGWAPYRQGRWSWLDWYGWSWVSYDPWGWAPYHYGRWFSYGGNWCWWPGAYRNPHYYWRPGLVAFFGWGGYSGIHAGIGFGNVGWVPLAPYERYNPWYGRGYYGGFRNHAYNNINITNVNIHNTYRNARMRNGYTAVGADDFVSGRHGRFVQMGNQQIDRASLVRGTLPVTPGHDSLRYSDRMVNHANLARDTGNTRFYSRRQPAQVDRVSFADQRRGMEEISRRAMNGPNGGSGGTAAGPVSRGDNARVNRTGDPSGSATAAGGGWRRVGEPAGNQRGGAAAGAAPSGSATDAGRSWRRFGEPATGGRGASAAGTARQDTTGMESNGSVRRSGGAGSRVDAQPSNRGVTRTEGGAGSNDNWRRFGEPANGARGTSVDRGTSRRESTGGGATNRFSEAPAGSRRSDSGSVNRESGSTWQRFEGNRSGIDRSSRQVDRGIGRSQESIRINPPLVRERSAPRMDRGIDTGGRGAMRSESSGSNRAYRSESGSRMSGGGGGMTRSGGGGGGGAVSRGGGGGMSRSSGGGGGGGGRSGGGGGGRGGGGRR